MSQIIRSLDQQQLKSLCGVVAHTSEGLTKSELTTLLYGVKTETAVSVCEKIFNDRFLANLLADEIGHDAIEANSIVGVMKSHKEDILDILSAYPTYFSERVQWICKD